MKTRRRMAVLDFLRGPLAYTEQPSDRERLQHHQERAARDLTRPSTTDVQVLPATKNGAPLERDAAKNTTNQERTLMAVPSIQPHWSDDRDLVVSVARFGVEVGDLSTVSDVIEFFDEPWHWSLLHDDYQRAMREDAHRENQIQLHMDRIGGTL